MKKLIQFPLYFILFTSNYSYAELYFNTDALHIDKKNQTQINLSTLSDIESQVPGEYNVLIKVNREAIREYKLNFINCDGNILCPELSKDLLNELGIKTEAFAKIESLDKNESITKLEDYIPDASSSFNFDDRILNLSIPQAAMYNQVAGNINPDLWDSGIPMFFTSYNASGLDVKDHQINKRYNSQYINFRNGLNIGALRLRNNSTYQKESQRKQKFKSNNTFGSLDIKSLRSRLNFGEIASPGLIFDTFNLIGVYLSTQDEMLPDSQQGYAPEIRGTAITNATVEIRQNGNLLYQTFVSPGSFVINDMFAISGSGDLVINIIEEDGSIRTLIQPFASPPISVRKGTIKYSVTAGKFNSNYYEATYKSINQKFIQGELLYGLNAGTTIYGGLTGAEHYHSGVIGIGQGLGNFGAISVDINQARSMFSNKSAEVGNLIKTKYSKSFDQALTSISLSSYIYTSKGYYSIDEASNYYYTNSLNSTNTPKSKFQLTLSQSKYWLLPASISIYQTKYWGEKYPTREISASWSKLYKGITFSLSQAYSRNQHTKKSENITSLSINIPLSKFLSPSYGDNIRMSNDYTRSTRGFDSVNSTISGTALSNNNLFWSISQSKTSNNPGGSTNSTAVTGTYQGSSATVGLGYSNYYGKRETKNWNMRGSFLIHPYGLTLSQQLSEGAAYALIKAPGAENVRITNQTGLSTNHWGYAVAPSLSPYRKNLISLDTSTLSDDVDITDPTHQLIPQSESLVLAEFDTRVGYRAFLTLTHNGKPLALGTPISVEGGITGISNELGQVWLSGLKEKAIIHATLLGNEKCQARFNVNDVKINNGIAIAFLECVL